MMSILIKKTRLLSAAISLAAGLQCSGLTISDTETGSEVENGLVVSVNDDTVVVNTRNEIPVVLIDAEYTPFDTSRSMLSQQSDLKGVVQFDAVQSGMYNVIVIDSSTGEGALLSGIAVLQNGRSTYKATFKELGMLSGVVSIVKNSQMDTVTSGSIGLVGTPLFGTLTVLHDNPVDTANDTLGYLFTMDHIPEGTYRFALHLEFNCYTCSIGASSYGTLLDHSVTVIPGGAVRDTLMITTE